MHETVSHLRSGCPWTDSLNSILTVTRGFLGSKLLMLDTALACGTRPALRTKPKDLSVLGHQCTSAFNNTVESPVVCRRRSLYLIGTELDCVTQ